MLLTDFLRHEIGATGTHVGCEHGVCGACTVEIDGKLTRACLTLAVQADGCAVRTVAGDAWGTIAAVDAGPLQDLLVIHDGALERLVPLVDELVLSIDLDARAIVVDTPDGWPEAKK